MIKGATATELNTNHNVYILGAGFSRAAGLPLINDFLVMMRDSRNWLTSQNRKAETDAIDSILRFRLEAASAAYWINLDLENIEELFSLAAANNPELGEKAQLAIAATLDFARHTGAEHPTEFSVRGASRVFNPFGGQRKNTPQGAPSWAHLVSKGMAPTVRPVDDCGTYSINRYSLYVARLLGMFLNGEPFGQNTFITFNYDTVLEDALKGLDLTHDYGVLPASLNFAEHAQPHSVFPPLPILKLHGSVNWARNQPPGVAVTAYENYHALRAKNLLPELVPPTWKKVFANPLDAVWETAIQRLGSATRIIIIGFSVPPTDMHFKYLLAAGLQNNISLRQILFVNPDERNELEEKARKLLRVSYVDSGMISFTKQPLGLFCSGNGSELAKIGRPPHEQNVTVTS